MKASKQSPIARRQMITLRASEDEKRGIKARANTHGMTVGAFLREAALDKPLPKRKRIPQDQGQKLALALASLGIIMTELRRIEQSLPQDSSALELVKSEIWFLRDQCFTSLRRTP